MERSEIAVTTETVPVPSYAGMIAGYRQALQIVDDVVLKNYLTRLSELEVVPLDLDTLRHSEKQNVLFSRSTKWHMRRTNLPPTNLPACSMPWPLPERGLS